ncbi:DsbA family protein [Acetobacteraceae bacterium ESL0709]|nr:DsbA family protein [Acetobacteraceae bacterium ESL0697]MDF7678901.1 DsbA family protein [Acetobacteraceae bacterium ESL0709]
MKRLTFFSVLTAFCGTVLVGGVHTARAEETHHFTQQEQAEIVQIMHKALKDDPQILVDAIQSLRQKATEQTQTQSLNGVKAHYTELETAPAYAIKGNPHGKVTIIEFLDPRCGYCRRMMPVLDELLKRHHDVRLIEKIVPVLGPDSLLASQAILAAALQGHYEEMRLALMNDAAKPDQDRIEDFAKKQGLDLDRFRQDMKGAAVKALIAVNVGQAQSIGLDGTPTFVFGQSAVIPGAISLEQMEQVLGKVH